MRVEKIRVLVVDDSTFSQVVITKALSGNDFEVCGVAQTGQEGIELYRLLQPDIVTMDFTMPDMDGLSCSQEILGFDPKARIVVLSAIKDKTLITQGNCIGVKAFLQKPIKSVELVETIHQVCSIIWEQDNWEEEYIKHFVFSLEHNIKDLAGLECKITINEVQERRFISQGLAIIMGLTGKRYGRIILDCSLELAAQLTQRMLNKATVVEDEILNVIAESTNIICGHSISQINNSYKDLELRLTPPSILFGENLSIFNPKFKSFLITAKTDLGRLDLNVGFGGGK